MRRNSVIGIGVLFLLAAVMVAGCPAPAASTDNTGDTGRTQPITLLTTTQRNTNPVTFNPTAAGKSITATVTGDVSGSRPRVQIRDNLNAVVADQPIPTSSTTTVSFTSTTTGQHVLRIVETGTAATTYTILVTEQP